MKLEIIRLDEDPASKACASESRCGFESHEFRWRGGSSSALKADGKCHCLAASDKQCRKRITLCC